MQGTESSSSRAAAYCERPERRDGQRQSSEPSEQGRHDGHHHGDHEGHDHAGHDHDHDHGVQLPEGLSDEDILEIQQALMAGLDKLKAEFEGIQE